MTVRMFHPQHGWTHAYSEPEVKDLEKQGWQVEAPKQPEPKQRRKSKEQQ
jgi:hypothetical protein